MVQDLMLEIEQAKDDFHRAVHTASDLEAALAATAQDCELVNLPVGTGGCGSEGLRRHLAEDVLPHLPADLTFRRRSRTGNRWQVVDEDTVCFTHDRELPWLLPGVAPTHRRAEVLAISVVAVRHRRITAHRTLWDHAGLVAQLHLDPSEAPLSRFATR